MKRTLALIILMVFTISTFASGIKTRMRPQDRFIFEPFVDIWQNVPGEIKSGSLDRGMAISYLYDYPIAMSNISIAAGISYTSHNYYTKSHLYSRVDDSAVFDFTQPEGLDIEKAKISLNYIAFPVEARIFARNLPKTLRFHVGFKTGILVSGYNKYSGKQEVGDNKYDVKVREYKLQNVDNLLYGMTTRIGYGRLNIYGFMPLNNIFVGNSSEEMKPISVGLSLILF